jgi:uncharacterized integral membrane protein (TIGR00698 family)
MATVPIFQQGGENEGKIMRSSGVSYTWGIALCVGIGAMAYAFSTLIPLGSVPIAIVLGAIVGNTKRLNESQLKGITFSEKNLLSFAIALMGVNLDFQILNELGFQSVLLVVVGLVFTIAASLIISRVLKIDRKLGLLLGIGNGVCGSSAIAATEQIMGAKEEQVGLSVAVVNFLGIIGMFSLPVVAKFVLNWSDIHSGILVGNTLQAVGQVVGAGFSISEDAGQIATLIKMTRILMLFPLLVVLVLVFSGPRQGQGNTVKKTGKPFFIVGFILFSLLPTFDILSPDYIKIVSRISQYSLIVAMAGIGLKISLHTILKDGKSALVAGGLIFLVQVIFSSVMVGILFL